MGAALERDAVKRVVDELAAAGVRLPQHLDRAVNTVLCGGGSTGARLWAAANPGVEPPPCCWSSLEGPDRCECWRPVYDVGQVPPRPPASPDELLVQPRMCGDCAFRPASPERANPLEAERLMELPDMRTPFWCHQGMRRPISWEHPDGRTVDGDPADYHPAMLGQVPFQADGSPALLCAGWAKLATRAAREVDDA